MFVIDTHSHSILPKPSSLHAEPPLRIFPGAYGCVPLSKLLQVT